MKGKHDVLTIIVITGVLFGVIASVWVWATPVIERNKDVFLLKATEDFTKDLAETIKFVAKNGGKAELKLRRLDPKGSVLIGPDKIEIFTTTKETVYDKNVEIPLKEMSCTTAEATWGLNTSDVICVLSVPLAKDKARTTFSIKFVQLNYDKSGEKRGYKIVLLPLTQSSGLNKDVVLVENKGVQENVADGRTLISTLVAISIV